MTVTQSKIRLAQQSDEPELLQLFKLMHAEGGMFPLSIDRVRHTFARAWNRQGGIINVIGAPGHIRAFQCLMLAKSFYTEVDHVEELWNWVHPDHRKSDYAKLLTEEAKRCSDELSKRAGFKMTLMMGVLTNKRMTAKVRLYRRFFGWPIGAFFVHNAAWVHKDEPCEEDFWKVPSLKRMLLRRSEHEEKRRIGVA